MRKTTLSPLLLSILGILLLLFVVHIVVASQTKMSLLFTVVIFALSICAVVLLFYLHIGRPLSLIYQALHQENTTLLTPLISRHTILGELAQAVVQSFKQKRGLEEEIAKHKETEIQLQEQHSQYRDLVETSPDAIICTNVTLAIVLSNKRANRLLGLPASASLVGNNLGNFVVDQVLETVCNKVCTGAIDAQLHSFETALKKISGEIFVAEVQLTLGKQPERAAYILFYIRDITLRKVAETEKARLDDQFRRSYKLEAIGQLAGGIAHDYNNILGAISGYADLIRHHYDEDERLKKYSSMILSASKRASDLTRKLLTFARKTKMHMVVFNVHEELSDLINLLKHTFDKSITIHYDTQRSTLFIRGDTQLFQNAIMNLTLNARDAMPDGGTLALRTTPVTLEKDFTHQHGFTTQPGNYLAISVTDTGTGMDQNTLSHLFEPFFTTKDIGKGTGLGLPSVYGTMKSHNGYIDVASKLAEGTTVTLYFPLVEESHDLQANNMTPIQTGKGHILLVDDENFLRDAIREMLSIMGYTVSVSSDASEALALFSTSPNSFDLVILDMKMPGIDGLDCFKRMKKMNEHVRVLISTGHCLDDERQELFDEGVLGIIQKPYVSAQLAEAVHKALGR